MLRYRDFRYLIDSRRSLRIRTDRDRPKIRFREARARGGAQRTAVALGARGATQARAASVGCRG